MSCLETDAVSAKVGSIGCCSAVVILLIAILIPVSIDRVEYYEYGLIRRAGGSVNTDKVYTSGRYMIGPAKSFIKYPADAHFESFSELAVFSAASNNASVGLEFKVDVDFTYLLQKDKIGVLHREVAKTYQDVIRFRASDGIKNEAIFVTFKEYFENRTLVERRFRTAVQKRWNEPPAVHATLDQFHLGRIRITDKVAEIQLESTVQNEKNSKESNLQQAAVEREKTAVDVNKITLETNKVLRIATAEANLIRANAEAEAMQIKSNANIDGAAALYQDINLQTQEEQMAYSYVRTIANRGRGTNNNNDGENDTDTKTTEVDLSYLTPDNILKTAPVA